MIRLDAGNVLLKPSHRKQLMHCLRRLLKAGERLGNFLLTVRLHRVGHAYEVRAAVHDRAGDFDCRARQQHWLDAVRDVARTLLVRLRSHRLSLAGS